MSRDKGQKIYTIPNLLTALRIILIPVITVLALFPGRLYGLLAALLYLIASLTDYFDGYLARRWDEVSPLGKIFDPMADKLLVTAPLIVLVSLDRAPALIVIIIICRELAITSLRGIAAASGIVIQAEEMGKYKTTFQTIAICPLLAHYEYFYIDLHFGGVYFLVVSMVIGVWSGIDYFRKFLGALLAQEGGDSE